MAMVSKGISSSGSLRRLSSADKSVDLEAIDA